MIAVVGHDKWNGGEISSSKTTTFARLIIHLRRSMLKVARQKVTIVILAAHYLDDFLSAQIGARTENVNLI